MSLNEYNRVIDKDTDGRKRRGEKRREEKRRKERKEGRKKERKKDVGVVQIIVGERSKRGKNEIYKNVID